MSRVGGTGPARGFISIPTHRQVQERDGRADQHAPPPHDRALSRHLPLFAMPKARGSVSDDNGYERRRYSPGFPWPIGLQLFHEVPNSASRSWVVCPRSGIKARARGPRAAHLTRQPDRWPARIQRSRSLDEPKGPRQQADESSIRFDACKLRALDGLAALSSQTWMQSS